MDEDNMPMAFPEGHVYSRAVREFFCLSFTHCLTCMFIPGAGRDGGKEWWHCDLSTDWEIVFVHRVEKGVYFMKTISSLPLRLRMYE
jgi:hypothetical protein